MIAIGCWQHRDITVAGTRFAGAWTRGATTADCRFRIDAPPGTSVLRITLAADHGVATFSGTYGLPNGKIATGGSAFGAIVDHGAIEVTVALDRSHTVLVAAAPTADATAVIATSSAT